MEFRISIWFVEFKIEFEQYKIEAFNLWYFYIFLNIFLSHIKEFYKFFSQFFMFKNDFLFNTYFGYSKNVWVVLKLENNWGYLFQNVFDDGFYLFF